MQQDTVAAFLTANNSLEDGSTDKIAFFKKTTQRNRIVQFPKICRKPLERICLNLFRRSQLHFEYISRNPIVFDAPFLVPKGGLEPPCREAHEPESCVSANFTTSAHRYKRTPPSGGADQVRTDDPHNAIVVLYQLSYDPAPRQFHRTAQKKNCQSLTFIVRHTRRKTRCFTMENNSGFAKIFVSMKPEPNVPLISDNFFHPPVKIFRQTKKRLIFCLRKNFRRFPMSS